VIAAGITQDKLIRRAKQRIGIQVCAGQDERRIGPGSATGVLAQPIAASSRSVAHQQLEVIMRKERLQRSTQCADEKLRRSRLPLCLGDSIQQCSNPFQVITRRALSRPPQSRYSAQGRCEPLRHTLELHPRDIAVPIGLEIRGQQETYVPAPESDRETDGGLVAGNSNYFLERAQLCGLQLGIRQGNGKIVLSQCCRPKEHNPTLNGIEPEGQQVVRKLD
jgi:hypothetical protein